MDKSKMFYIDSKPVGGESPVYFIADIAANHDGDLEKAKDLIYMAAEAGADAAKFQHFTASTIVSDQGFKNLRGGMSHQKEWKKSVYEVYQDASVKLEWSEVLKETCDRAGITFFTSPYSKELVDHIDNYVPAYKIGSGDISWIEIIEYIAKKNKPYILATGAASMEDVVRAVSACLPLNEDFCLMQCNTNYTASLENFKYINLNVLKTYAREFPSVVLGLSDHTPGHSTVLGSVALGAKVIEKHFTDSNDREGPDHKFSMTPTSWREMVDRCRELELSLGGETKKIEENEKQTAIVQRRSLCVNRKISEGETLKESDLTALRPSPDKSIPPFEAKNVIGCVVLKDLEKGEHLEWHYLKK
ncbi:N-acetylneuraminate synthase family protein [Halomonas sp. EF61]|uniref:N-acetylneuraminate synthase family protein n=1 Tax=Halomonas sp. EF61 TaxID=2950869 RepID=UPI0032DE5FDF